MFVTLPLYYVSGMYSFVIFLLSVLAIFIIIWIIKLVLSVVVGG